MPFLRTMLCFGKKKREKSKKKIKLQLECEEQIEAFRSENAKELNSLKESFRKEIAEIENRHQLLLDDYKKQSPNVLLKEEVRSLGVVVDMRNDEIRKLREDLIHYKEIQDDLIQMQQNNQSLQARVEDLASQLQKSQTDKRELREKLSVLESNLSKMGSENNRLSQCNDQLTWTIQSVRTDGKENVSISKLHHVLDMIPPKDAIGY